MWLEDTIATEIKRHKEHFYIDVIDPPPSTSEMAELSKSIHRQ